MSTENECTHSHSDVFGGLNGRFLLMERVCMDCTHTIERKKVNRDKDTRDPFTILDEWRGKKNGAGVS